VTTPLFDLDTDLDTIVLDALDFEPGCQGRLHAYNARGHISTESAKWLLQLPCGCTGLLVCNSRMLYIMSIAEGIYCTPCGAEFEPSPTFFTPL